MQKSRYVAAAAYHRSPGIFLFGEGSLMKQLKRNMLSVALASATMMVATGAWAQSTTTTTTTDADTAAQDQAKKETPQQQQAKQLQTVTVTGIRAGIESAINVKQQSTSIVEAISAEDIGKL